MARNRKKRRPMSEINVVPYIDVMLVLLIIFMVTAPMLMQGVKVDLPEASADPVENQDSEPVIVSVDAAGQLFLNLGQEEQVLSLATIKDRVAAVMRRSPEKPVLVWGDRAVPYGEVVTVMVALQEAGAPSVGLVTENPSEYLDLCQACYAAHCLAAGPGHRVDARRDALSADGQLDQYRAGSYSGKAVPKVINARLVDVSEFQPKPKPKPQPKPKPKPPRWRNRSPKPNRSPSQNRRPRRRPNRQPKPEPKPAPKPSRELAERNWPRLPALSCRVLAQEAAGDRDRGRNGRELRRPDSTDGYQLLEPPAQCPQWHGGRAGDTADSHRGGGQRDCIRSSGNTAFDRSAINAVEKAGAFPELQKLPSREFEKTFRRFRLLFKPEDLRY